MIERYKMLKKNLKTFSLKKYSETRIGDKWQLKAKTTPNYSNFKRCY